MVCIFDCCWSAIRLLPSVPMTCCGWRLFQCLRVVVAEGRVSLGVSCRRR